MIEDDDNILERLIGGIKTATNPKSEDQLLERVTELQASEKKVSSLENLDTSLELPSSLRKEQPDSGPSASEGAAGSIAPSTKTGKGEKKQAPVGTMVGLDVGTSRIVGISIDRSSDPKSRRELNAYFTVPYSDFAKQMLEKNRMHFSQLGDELAIYGFDAQTFANMFNGEILRPMQTGLLRPDDERSLPMEKKIIEAVIGRAGTLGEHCCFSIPSPIVGQESNLIFHEQVLKKYLLGMGYKAKGITEGTAVVLSELASSNYTGIGISMGAGMCNVCFSFLSVPIVVFGTDRGGDYIDASVSRVVKEPMNKVRLIKEQELNLGKAPTSNLENALHVYHEELISNLLSTLSTILANASNFPQINEDIPVVISGGTSAPAGFKSKFEKVLKNYRLPVQIGDVRVANDPHMAVAKGALIYATSMR
ncbi:MAG: hypothetical protein HN353_09820 [Bdellovibrionales bacterium]|jgi:hypothetical protein|nr:hypothetical protein [Bdellovibrionales bacterium]MBT3527196.1 hypothetical protein [Bdellovibrionales bacterium]MBT7668486.1 hypothetical protein [Bdellovibrionales bacterium]MBT7765844.1 hypothetical protein [Bdellovibrionales bacterium]